ncbi:hypothetical protein EB796_019863 [Bugula neritina]|uniref:SPT2 n=1 Tax=Bugula neritina TaxID=10212 RepID=A0A7J7J6N5_BUGNE|nr:hypothetical protein EB796_019863 [Bugula neritina]
MNGTGGGGDAVPVKKLALSEAARANVAPKSASLGQQSKSNLTSKRPNSVKASPAANQKATQSQSKTKEEVKPAVSAWDRLMGTNSSANKDKPKKKAARYIDSEDEDDDLDDFIADDDDDMDYSSHIRDIFGYDKSRYRDEDFDDRSMVAGFADIMKEEVRSARIGREEDLKDIELEEMEKKRKKLKKNRK